ncbi:hypothetical protein I7I50_03987 [Histoplasma capsulatum G186AR]|uniref:Uncharacterized protein n=1 Tax=Ajellomyces capsulatus TaxID=5037 RepID=A0A8H7YJI2_AJECA|nr:hypothetical protein I7I52_04895 [Histoplasma capsulatum]QSS74995.1 hypothetical protein I7I50_03987 [Histoplasma capsulatum G186AR]
MFSVQFQTPWITAAPFPLHVVRQQRTTNKKAICLIWNDEKTLFSLPIKEQETCMPRLHAVAMMSRRSN